MEKVEPSSTRSPTPTFVSNTRPDDVTPLRTVLYNGLNVPEPDDVEPTIVNGSLSTNVAVQPLSARITVSLKTSILDANAFPVIGSMIPSNDVNPTGFLGK